MIFKFAHSYHLLCQCYKPVKFAVSFENISVCLSGSDIIAAYLVENTSLL